MDVDRRALEWTVGKDTGTSSKTIWSVMVGVVQKETPCTMQNCLNVLRDPDDFGRCHRLLELLPEWRGRLETVTALLPKWRPLVREWAELERLYREKRYHELYERMKSLEDEGMLLDGWVKDSSGWKRELTPTRTT